MLPLSLYLVFTIDIIIIIIIFIMMNDNDVQGVFFNWPPPKKPRLGKSTLT